MRHRITWPALLAITALTLAACGGSAGATAGAGASTAAEVSQAPATAGPAASAAAPSAAAPSEAPASEAPSSIPIPSFDFPSTDKALEALLPDTICGKKVQKLSMGGETFATAADPEFVAVLQKLGKTPSDVSFAIAAPLTASGDCTAGIFRIKGADGDALKAAFLAEAAKQGTKYEVKSIGGKDVYVDPTSTSLQYAYFKGDAVLFVSAPSESEAGKIIAVLP